MENKQYSNLAPILFRLCATHAGKNGSAQICYADSVSLFERAEYELSVQCSIRSLKYSVGIFHLDYQNACDRYAKI